MGGLIGRIKEKQLLVKYVESELGVHCHLWTTAHWQDFPGD